MLEDYLGWIAGRLMFEMSMFVWYYTVLQWYYGFDWLKLAPLFSVCYRLYKTNIPASSSNKNLALEEGLIIEVVLKWM